MDTYLGKMSNEADWMRGVDARRAKVEKYRFYVSEVEKSESEKA